jgi:hypothetical protein
LKISQSLLVITMMASAIAISGENPPSTLINELQGVYKHRFQNGTVDGEKYQSEDIVEIVAFDATSIYIRTHIEFFNGHQCDISGIAKYENGFFVYHSSEKAFGTDLYCTLKVSQDQKNINLTDIDEANQVSTCSYFCGARGSFNNYSISKSSKRNIRYLDRLKASTEYNSAVEEYQKSQSKNP